MFDRSHRMLAGFFLATALSAGLFLPLQSASSATVDDLQHDIDAKKQEIQNLQEQAKKYRVEIATRQQAGKTLKDELKRIEAVIQQLRNDIAITQQKIGQAELEIRQIQEKISQKEISISRLQSGLSELLRALAEKDRESLLAIIARSNHLSDFFTSVDAITEAKKNILATADSIRKVKQGLEAEHSAEEQKKTGLEDLRVSLAYRQKVEAYTRTSKTVLLTETRNQEKQYQALLTEQEKKKQQLEDEISRIETKIKFALDASTIPQKRAGVLGYPLPDVSLGSCWGTGNGAENCVTQLFGYTEFALGGAYGTKGHNGMDFRAAVGTPVLAAESGTIMGAGDTDIGCRGSSYGKWVLVRHPNNLATIYGHLSAIRVSPGESVARGATIAYSGKTGYATGPHLHFGVYAAEAVKIQTIQSKVCGRSMTLPIAPVNGYIDPMNYL